MRLNRTAVALVPLAALMLGGCQSIFGQAFSGRSADVAVKARSDIEAGEAFADAQLAAGRAALVEGRYAAAIASFSKARTTPSQAAEALNGMAVSYAGIGRLDLAERYFRQAIVVAPGDARFQRNLARLEAIGPARQAGPAQPQMASAAPAARTLSPSIRVAAPQNGLTRVSANEVVLRTASAPAAPAKSRGKAIVRIDLAKIARPAR